MWVTGGIGCCEVVVSVPVGDCGGEDAGVEGVELVGVEVSDGSGNAGRKMTGEVEYMVIRELVSKDCWIECLCCPDIERIDVVRNNGE